MHLLSFYGRTCGIVEDSRYVRETKKKNTKIFTTMTTTIKIESRACNDIVSAKDKHVG